MTVHQLLTLADIVPDAKVIANAKEKGLSHLIKAFHQEQHLIGQGSDKAFVLLVKTNIEAVDALKAIRQLLKLHGPKLREKANRILK